MPRTDRQQYEHFYAALQAFGRIYTFRDPNNASLFDLRVNECYVLDYLAGSDGVTVSSLAETLGIHKSNASRIAMALQDRKLVDSVADNEDRRAVTLKVTAKGRARHAEISAHFVDRLEKIISDFSGKDIQTAMDVITRLTGDAEQRIVLGED